MFYLVYKITNMINGKIYIGQHKTTKIDDGYMGSGKLIKRAIQKHGVENFSKEIIRLCENEDEMKLLEAKIVDEDFINDPMTYNLTSGGTGGFGFINRNGLGMNSERGKMMVQKRDLMHDAASRRNNAIKGAKTCKERGLAAYSDENKRRLRENPPFKDRQHSHQTKKIMRDLKIGVFDGDKNPAFGTKWITDGSSNQKIGKDDPIPEGWRAGRVMKKKNTES